VGARVAFVSGADGHSSGIDVRARFHVGEHGERVDETVSRFCGVLQAFAEDGRAIVGKALCQEGSGAADHRRGKGGAMELRRSVRAFLTIGPSTRGVER